MLGRLSKRAIETLEFRGVLVALALVAALIVYFSLFGGHRPKADHDVAPTVPPSQTLLPDRP